MAGDIPNYGKDIPEDAFITVDESEQSDCETNNPEPAPVEKSAAKQRKRKDGTDSYRKQFLMLYPLVPNSLINSRFVISVALFKFSH